jgi:hypothetical protein
MENHHAVKNGKPSISIRAIYTMAMFNCQRIYIYTYEKVHPKKKCEKL